MMDSHARFIFYSGCLDKTGGSIIFKTELYTKEQYNNYLVVIKEGTKNLNKIITNNLYDILPQYRKLISCYKK